jgi:hypothetical protein
MRDSLSVIRPNQSSRVQAPVLLKMNCGMRQRILVRLFENYVALQWSGRRCELIVASHS